MREDIIKWAQEAGFRVDDADFVYPKQGRVGIQLELERFAALVAAAEREAILQMSAATWFKTQSDYDAAIRARKD
jgi:hypothetical protein